MKRKGSSTPTQSDIARLAGVRQGTVSKILNNWEDSFDEETKRRVFEAAQMLGYDVSKLAKRKRAPRRRLGDHAALDILCRANRRYSSGRARVENISISGALLTNIALDKGSFPADTFRLQFRVLEGPLKDLSLRSKPIRFAHERRRFSLGIQFEAVPRAAKMRVNRFVRQEKEASSPSPARKRRSSAGGP